MVLKPHNHSGVRLIYLSFVCVNEKFRLFVPEMTQRHTEITKTLVVGEVLKMNENEAEYHPELIIRNEGCPDAVAKDH